MRRVTLLLLLLAGCGRDSFEKDVAAPASPWWERCPQVAPFVYRQNCTLWPSVVIADGETTFLAPATIELFPRTEVLSWRFAIPWDPEGLGPGEFILLEHGDTTTASWRPDGGA